MISSKHNSHYYAVEAANLEERLISGVVLTAAAGILALSIATFTHANSSDGEAPSPTTPPSTVEIPTLFTER